jgi:hypothetical protein
MDAWKEGFATREDTFKWAATSRFFCAQRLEEAQNRSKRKEIAKRDMYNHFLIWGREQQRDGPEPTWTPESVVAEALVYFNKKAEYDELMKEYARVKAIHEARRRVKSKFNGILVEEWTGLRNLDVKKVMDKVRERVGGEIVMDVWTTEEIRSAVRQASLELGYTISQI